MTPDGPLRPLDYPAAAHVRKHGPAGYAKYEKYKPWLRDEYSYRCVYCLTRETWYPTGAAAFSVDHILPQSQDPTGARVCDYDNLLYACSRCNSARRELSVLNPDQVALGEHLGVTDEGFAVGRTPEGKNLIDILHLNEDDLVQARQETLAVLRLMESYPDNPDVQNLYARRFGYPRHLPNLRMHRPPVNSRPQGLDASHYDLRARDALSLVY